MAVQSADVYPLIHEASAAAAAARERGDTAEYEYQRKRMEVLQDIYAGYGNVEDLLELEKAKKWGAIGNIFGGISTTGMLLLGAIGLMFLGKRR